MVAKKVPVKKTTMKAIGLLPQAQAEMVVKKAFLEMAKSMGPSNIRKYGGGIPAKRQGSIKQWAKNVDNAMGDTWFEGGEVEKVGYHRANAILRANREKWITPMYNRAIGPRNVKINKANALLQKNKKK